MWPTTIRSLFGPKGAPALFEVGLDSEGGDVRQLNNAEQTLKVSSLYYSDFSFLFLKLQTVSRLWPLVGFVEAGCYFSVRDGAFKADGC